MIDNSEKVKQIVEAASKVDEHFDPNGSYTGIPIEPDETPVQDADDL